MEKHTEKVGLFDYPVLMAADILIYGTEGVPVGEDQVQHIELAQNLARRFNSKFGQTFTEPKPLLTEAKRVMGLDGKGKMSKSSASSTYIALNDNPDIIRQKIAAATTDTGTGDDISPATLNLIGLMENFAGKEPIDILQSVKPVPLNILNSNSLSPKQLLKFSSRFKRNAKKSATMKLNQYYPRARKKSPTTQEKPSLMSKKKWD